MNVNDNRILTEYFNWLGQIDGQILSQNYGPPLSELFHRLFGIWSEKSRVVQDTDELREKCQWRPSWTCLWPEGQNFVSSLLTVITVLRPGSLARTSFPRICLVIVILLEQWRPKSSDYDWYRSEIRSFPPIVFDSNDVDNGRFGENLNVKWSTRIPSSEMTREWVRFFEWLFPIAFVKNAPTNRLWDHATFPELFEFRYIFSTRKGNCVRYGVLASSLWDRIHKIPKKHQTENKDLIFSSKGIQI
jgi:hypothetical protein